MSTAELIREFGTDSVRILTETPKFAGEAEILQTLLRIIEQPSEDGDNLTDQYPPDAPLFKEENRRNYEPIVGDPFLQLVELDAYRSIGQREAIRAVLTTPDNSTLIINLPTGAGKR
ncbi:hypothetical protein [Nostoc sp.]|uniref:hypothetical protein n=1 Tax=Nostoc sp. TaxID=1180 RepID=UPI002FF648BF